MRIPASSRNLERLLGFVHNKSSVTWYIGRSLLVSVVLVSFIACRTAPRRDDTDAFISRLKHEVGYFTGSPITGYISIDPNSLRAEESLAVTMSWVVIKQLPKNLLYPAESQTRMIKIFPAQKPVSPVVQLTRGTRIGSIENAKRFIDRITNDGSNGGMLIGRLYAVLPQGITTSFSFTEKNPIDSQSSDGFKIQIFNRTQTENGQTEEPSVKSTLDIVIVATGKLKQDTETDQENMERADEEDKDSDLGGENIQITETVFLNSRPFNKRDQFAIILKSRFTAEENEAFAVIIDVSSPPHEDRLSIAMHSTYFNQCLEYLKREDARNRILCGKPDIKWAGLEDSIQLLQSPNNERRALIHLAEQTNASLVKDIALSGTETVVGQLSQAVINEYLSGSINNSEIVGWILERTAYSLLARLLSAEQATPELEAILIRHTGQVGRNVSTLEELIASSNTIEELQRYFVRENFIFLEDISPAARTRAFDWLSARGKAPDGYDPLSPLKQRRDVLSRVEMSFD
jgi:hypothetical protein